MSVANWFQRKGAVMVNDLLVIRKEEGLDGRVKETVEEDLRPGLNFVLFIEKFT